MIVRQRVRRANAMAAAAVIAAVAIIAASLAAPAQASAPTPRALAPARGVVAPIPTLNWHACFGGDLECTRAAVPLDYDDPTGATVSIFMSRLLARDPAHRIGSLFVNPGGPGVPASLVVQPIAGALGSTVRDRFDVIGIDPRGIGRSQQVRCQSDTAAPDFPAVTVPLTLNQARPLIRFDSWIANSCADEANDILDHMSTADTARDMDLIRQAVGDSALSYYGISYGTYLGATYAAMFPDDVRAIVVDGVLDPVAWSTGRDGRGDELPFSTRLRSGVGAWEALTSAFAECDRVGAARCRFAGRIADEWRGLIQRLRHGPIHLRHGSINYSVLVEGALGSLYDRRSVRFLFHAVDNLYRMAFHPSRPGAGKGSVLDDLRRLADRAPDNPYGTTALSGAGDGRPSDAAARARAIFPSFEGVTCTDSVNPTDPTAWVRAGAIADRQGPWFGRAWTWASGACAHWPGSKDDAFTGPWRTATAQPLLVIGNFHDPATPISGARTVNTLFEGSRMISLNTWGHGAIGQSACVTARIQHYLVDLALPPNGLVCQANKQLFPQH
jgi:pimeloyl-ACP methyl ester carboxylesterase